MNAFSHRQSEEQERRDRLEEVRQHGTHQLHGDVSAPYDDVGTRGQQEVDGAKVDEGKENATGGPMMIVVMGVSGSGKSTLGAALAKSLGLPFEDADALHPKSNIDKMSQGIPLTDADRQPWLEIVRAAAVKECEKQDQVDEDDRATARGGRRGVVVGCSALKRAYRDVLRGHSHDAPAVTSASTTTSESSTAEEDVPRPPHPAELPTYFVYINGERGALLQRMETRQGHFMKAGMLDSQLATLESPEGNGEPNVVVVSLEETTEEQVRRAREGLRDLGANV